MYTKFVLTTKNVHYTNSYNLPNNDISCKNLRINLQKQELKHNRIQIRYAQLTPCASEPAGGGGAACGKTSPATPRRRRLDN